MMMKRYLLIMILVAIFVSVAFADAAAEEPMSILLLGTDSLGNELVTGDEEMSRADAIYVLKLFPDTGAIKLLSIERDYLVTLSDGVGKNKLGTSTYFGGPEMAMDAVNELLSLNIDLYAQIDLAQLVAAVDVIGGLSVEVFESEVEDLNSFFDVGAIVGITGMEPVCAGINQLNGDELWAFVRLRDGTGDAIASNEERNDRQMRAIRAGLRCLSEMDLSAAVAVVEDLLPYLKTNLTMSDILASVQLVQTNGLEGFAYLRTPSTPYTRKRVGVHQVVVANDMMEETRVVADFLAK